MGKGEKKIFLGDEDMLDGAGWEDGGARTFVPSHLLGGETTTTAVRGKGERGDFEKPNQTRYGKTQWNPRDQQRLFKIETGDSAARLERVRQSAS